ncbi:hypothetical protein FG386_001921 [Cryptosporidium ryanae]|uniref:uncharacterized protein n=1 Tax=Cryptosporidium ryanae TaxID=515981 RepID=UPI00351A2FE4|nr:hypothetical protein FG386_001921 [Cryptosporidium ryanae]
MEDIPLRTYCMIFGYDGTGYHGMQIQMRNNKKVDEIETIEGEIESCFEKLNIFYVNEDINKCKSRRSKIGERNVTEDNFLKKIRWSRVGRTDKGVHSVCQVVSFRAKIRINNELSSIIDKKNKDERTRELVDNLLMERNILNKKTDIDVNIGDRENPNFGVNEDNLSGNGNKTRKIKNNPLLPFINDSLKSDNVESNTSPSEEFINELIILNYIVEKMNELLDSRINVFKIIRVTKNFDARTDCSRRQYEYIMPEYLLYPVELTDLELKKELENVCELRYKQELIEVNNNKRRKREESNGTSNNVEDKSENIKIFEFHQLNRQNNYGFGNDKKLVNFANTQGRDSFLNNLLKHKIDNNKLKEFQSILDEYTGTHSFHNFTSKSSYYDSNSWRHIDDIKAEFIDISDNECVNKINTIRVIIRGQSFMLHQIRKMIALAIEVFRGTAPKNAIKLSFLPNKLFIHLSPSQGLLLDRVSYRTYNIKRSISTEKKDFNVHSISFDNNECQFVKKMERFKRDFIYKRIYETITKQCSLIKKDDAREEYDNNK